MSFCFLDQFISKKKKFVIVTTFYPHFSSFPLWYSCLPQTLCLFWGVHNFFKMTVLHLLSVRTKNRWWVRHRPLPCYKHRTGGFPGSLLGVAFKVLLAHFSLLCGHCLLPVGTSYTCFPACLSIGVSYTCLVPTEVRRGCQISKNKCYNWLWATKCVLGTRTFGRIASALNRWVRSPAPFFFFAFLDVHNIGRMHLSCL